ncbi:MAG: thiolase family protein [Promethearchaeia archaeon]
MGSSPEEGNNMEKVGIVGYYQVKPDLDMKMSQYEMDFTAVRGALDYAGLKRDDISTVVGINNDYYDGKTISNCFKVESGGAYMKDETKVEMDGAHGLMYALWRLLSGNHNLAVIYGTSMPSCFPYESARVLECDPTFDRPINLLNSYTAGAMQMRAYMYNFGITEEDIANVAVANYKNAAENPLALSEARKPNITVDEVLESDYLSSPLRELMYPLLCDSCTALIVAPERLALKITDKPVWITGVGHNNDTYYLGDRDLSKSISMERAAKKAYDMANINDPAEEIDVAEIFGHTACEDLILAEAAGLAEKGKGLDLLEKDLLNPSGGTMAGFTPCANGLTRIVEAAKQLRGEAEGHQIKRAQYAIATGQVGFCAQNNILFVLEGGTV